MSNAGQGTAISRPVLLGLTLLVIIVGGAYAGYLAIQKHNRDSVEGAVIIGSVSSQDQAAAEQVFQSFVSDVRGGTFDQALQLTAESYPKPHTAGALRGATQHGLAPFLTSDALRFEPAHLAAHGQRMFLRAGFHASGKRYRTVCTLIKAGSGWRISDIVAPVAPGKPPTSSSGGAAAM